MKCTSCGADNPSENQVCQFCGVYLEPPAPPQAPPSPVVVNNYAGPVTTIGAPPPPPVSAKEKSIALILCIFLGVLGGHYFYVGKIGMGVLYLLTCGLFCIGWIIDIFKIASGNFADSRGILLN